MIERAAPTTLRPAVALRGARMDPAERRRRALDLGVLGLSLALLVLGLAAGEALRTGFGPWSVYAVFLSAWAVAGWNVLAAASRGLARGRVFDENFLMTVATLGAIAIGELPEAAGVMIFYRAGEILQGFSVGRSRRTIRAMLETRPDRAVVRREGQDLAVSPADVAVGETLVVRVGERVALDGVVTEGSGSMDTSTLTGESVPRETSPGGTVLAGWVSLSGHLLVRTTRPFAETSVARMMELVQNAVARKARTELFFTRFARSYTPAVVGAALLLALLPPLLVPGQTLSVWAYRALVLLMISCPCALVASIPLGYFGGVGGAAKRGVLVKGSSTLEALARVDTVLFDKTGTLTTGTFRVTDIVPRGTATRDDVLRLAATAEAGSTHPIARSVVLAWSGAPTRPAHRQAEYKGLGVKAHTSEGVIVAGSHRLLHQEDIEHDGCDLPGTVVHVALEGRHKGHLVVGDTVRPEAARAVSRLRRMGVRTIGLLTGDRGDAAQLVADRVGADTVHAELLPEQKVETLEKVLSERVGDGAVAVVGDGVNDAPVLARADVGIAMGRGGSEAAIETADVVLMTDAPDRVADAIDIARFTRSIVIQNVVLALAVKGVFLTLGALGLTTLWGAVVADVGTAVLAILNATRVFAHAGRMARVADSDASFTAGIPA